MKANCILGCNSKSRVNMKMIFPLYLAHLRLHLEYNV